MTIDSTDRRTVLRGVAIVGAGAALTACGAKTSSDSGAPADTGSTAGTSSPTGSADSAGGKTIGKASDVPVGSGKIFPNEKVVVTQLTKDDFKAYTAVCTHQGCIVSSIDTKEIHCGCHGSRYSIKDGSVVGGPAPAPLKAESVTDDAGTIKFA